MANRFYYQRSIPLKDAAILSNCPLREVRRAWLHRLTDHDGLREGEGGGNALNSRVESVQWQGDALSVVLDVQGHRLRLTCAPLAEPPEPGTRLALAFDQANVSLVPEAASG